MISAMACLKSSGSSCWLGIMEKKMETTIVYWGYMGIMEKEMETTSDLGSSTEDTQFHERESERIRNSEAFHRHTSLTDVTGLQEAPGFRRDLRATDYTRIPALPSYI